MVDYLVFTLVAPMGSFGGPAGHERRGSLSWPGRSAVLGLIGAALGVRRGDADGQARLGAWRVAVSVLSDSHPLRDFHTVQTVPTANIKRPATRRDALAALKSGDNPVITRRDYRTDCAFGVAIWGGDAPEEVEAALKTPHFTPYLGRKSCPLSAPMDPRSVRADNVVQALAQVSLPSWLTGARTRMIASDAPLPGGWEEVLWDDPIDRQRWHFAPRVVHVQAPGDGT